MSFFRYVFRYSLRDMAEFLKNEKRDPAPWEGSLKGKTAVITGATSGIGLETAVLFAQRGANLILCNRSPEKSQELAADLHRRFGVQVTTILADFTSLAQTKACAEALLAYPDPLDFFIHNAGVYYTKKTLTQDGLEMVFQVNHLSSFYLNHLLLERFKREDRVRILYVNSEGHRFALGGVHPRDLEWKWHRYSGLRSYGAAKTAQLLCMPHFAQEFAGTRVTINAMHPGNVHSHIGENNGRIYNWIKRNLVLTKARDPKISAQALLFLAADPGLDQRSAVFFNLTSPEKPAPHALDKKIGAEIWQKSLQLCGLA